MKTLARQREGVPIAYEDLSFDKTCDSSSIVRKGKKKRMGPDENKFSDLRTGK